MKSRAEHAPRGAALLLLALALCLLAGWRAGTLGFARFWANQAPARSLHWRPNYADALLGQAQRSIRRGGRPDVDAVRVGLAAAPAKARAFRFLGAEAQARGDTKRALELYTVAAARDPRDLPSLAWLADQALARGDYPEAIARMDRILRVEPQIEHKLAPAMLTLAATPGAHAALAEALAARPPWRKTMLGRIVSRSPDVASVFPLIERLRTQPGGLDREELSAWIDLLARDGQWGPAYLTWIQSLTPEASQHIGNVYDGSFEGEPGQSGFGWRFDEVAGANITREQTTGAGDRLALRVKFDDDRVPFHHVRQMLALPPGHFVLSGRVRLDDLRSERGLVWTLNCVGSRKAIAESEPFSGRREWRDFRVEFDVPGSADCGGQWLTLVLPARIPAEQRVGGIAWFDDLRIKQR
jgi:tetratricopeptide (TPR) repeat protein